MKTDPVYKVVRPGWQTTEFYVTIVASISGILLALGYLDQPSADALVESVKALSGGIITIVSVVAYIWSRKKAKE